MKNDNEKKKTTKKKTNVSSKSKPATKTSSKKTSTATKRKSTTQGKKNNTNAKKTVTKKPVEIKEELREEKEIKKEEKLVQETKTSSKKSKEDETIFVLRTIAIILAFILVVVCSVKLFFNLKDETYGEKWSNKSYLVEKGVASSVTCDELPEVIKGDNRFIFVTTTGEDEFKLEKNLKKIIEDYHLKDSFYVYTLNDNCGPISSLDSIVARNLKLPYVLNTLPTVIYYRDGDYIDEVKRLDKQMMDSSDFVQLLDMYEFKK